MRVLSVISAGTALAAVADGFSLTMNGAPAGRSALAAQYKNIMSIHSGLLSGGSSRMAYPTMMPPPTDPDPEVRPRRRGVGLGGGAKTSWSSRRGAGAGHSSGSLGGWIPAGAGGRTGGSCAEIFLSDG